MDQLRLDGIEIPRPSPKRSQARAGALIAGLSEDVLEVLPAPGESRAGLLTEPLARQSGVGEGRLRQREVLEAEDRGERVVELRRPALEHRAELVVGQKRSERLERVRPAEGVEIS